jgi:hypothetical protein
LYSTDTPEKDPPADDVFDGIFQKMGRPLTASQLHGMKLLPAPDRLCSGFKLMTREISDFFERSGTSVRLTFEFIDSHDLAAWSDCVGDEYIIGINIGLYKRLAAILRQIALTNAFGKYSQITYFTVDTLRELLSLPDIQGLRKKEETIPIDSLLNARGSLPPDPEKLDHYLAGPPLDKKHRFDMQSLVVPALMFTYWHELAHVLLGHFRWARSENDIDEKVINGLEYIADDYAARRIAYDILQSALRENGSYVLGPFWFNRSGFEAVGELEGMPGADIKFNLEGFMYRIAFALEILIYDFPGFFAEPVTHQKKKHPHPEIRLARIVDVIGYHMRTARFDIRSQAYLVKVWEAMYGYAMHTAEKALAGCGSKQLPLQRDGRQIGNMFHAFDIPARVKASNHLVQTTSQATSPFAYSDILGRMEPADGALQFPKDRQGMIEIEDDFPKIFKREFQL